MTAEEAPHDAVSPARPLPHAAPDAPPPRPPHELDPGDGPCRRFEAAGEEWLAWTAGKGAGGTGSYGLGMVEALHFARGSEPDTPLFETLVAAGRFAGLYDEELRTLLREARRIVTLAEARSTAEARTGRGLGDR